MKHFKPFLGVMTYHQTEYHIVDENLVVIFVEVEKHMKELDSSIDTMDCPRSSNLIPNKF